jgi:hypothetical protein
MLEISCVAEQLLVSQERPSSMQIICSLGFVIDQHGLKPDFPDNFY